MNAVQIHERGYNESTFELWRNLKVLHISVIECFNEKSEKFKYQLSTPGIYM